MKNYSTNDIVEKVLKTSNSSISNKSIKELQTFENNYNIKLVNGPIVEYMNKLS